MARLYLDGAMHDTEPLDRMLACLETRLAIWRSERKGKLQKSAEA